jgi:HCOMODA/2-hydroxy-3-carboxy-muconic semialdehyde decarboxylase
VPDALAEARDLVSRANRIIANEGVLDAFGHVSMRDPGRYLLSRARAPELVEPADVLEFTLDSEPVQPTNQRLYLERVIHGEIYRARPDVNAIAHHHAPAVMPFCITGIDLVPVFHLGATIGNQAPLWDQRDEFGDTNLLVVKAQEGRSLARTLGSHSMVLMRRHGATVVGGNIPELVFRTIYSCRNAELQMQAQALGTIAPLSPGEIARAGAINAQPNVTARTWEYWSMRLAKAEKRAGAAQARVASVGKRARLAASRSAKRQKIKGRKR